MLLKDIPRVRLAQLPTPLQEATRLTSALGGPRILIKRDDLTGLLLGGNKARKLEFVMADALKEGADVIITTGATQSNHATQTAAAARKLGMDVILVLWKNVHAEQSGNLLLNDILDAEVHIVDEGMNGYQRPQLIRELACELRSKGRKPYVIPGGASTPLGALGYVNAVAEIYQQMKEQGLTAQYLLCPVGSCGTVAGIAVGAETLLTPFQVIGIGVNDNKEILTSKVTNLAGGIAGLLGRKTCISLDNVTIYDEYIGDGYGIATPDGNEAIRLVAQTEGIILDPVYSGKAMAGLIDLVRKGRFKAGDIVIFVHTGGAPSVFAYAEELLRSVG